MLRPSPSLLSRSDDQVRQDLVFGNILIAEARSLEALQKPCEVFLRVGFDADQDRTEIAGRFLQILETGDIVVRAKQIEEIAQRAGRCGRRRMKYFFTPV